MGNQKDRDVLLIRQALGEKRYLPRGPQKIADVLASMMARRGYAQIESEFAFSKAWREAVGQQLAEHSRPARIRRSVLEVITRSSIVMQELSFQKTQILRSLTKLLPEKRIRDLRFRFVTIDP